MTIDLKEKPMKAVLVGVQLPKVTDEEHSTSMNELARLVSTLGYEVIGKLSQKRGQISKGIVLGEGKLEELARWTGGSGIVTKSVTRKISKAAMKFTKNQKPEKEPNDEPVQTLTDEADVAIFDCDLTPLQQKNLQKALGIEVLDRSGVIIEIFSKHANTRAARLQVEIARLNYLSPRLRETGPSERLGQRSSGETSVELDRRRIRDRLKEIKNELESIAGEHETRRSRRRQENTIAIVGYTNAGKSSLMRAMTGSEVYVANKLFATLDTTVRAIHPGTHPKILLSDTVGFIRKLPHDLVASFRSTLDEALNASLLIHLVDASSATRLDEMEVTRSVLKEIGAMDVPVLLVFNKRDLLTAEQQSALQAEFPESMLVSALNKDDISRLREKLIGIFEQGMVEEEIHIPFATKGIIGDLRSQFRVLSESYDAKGVKVRVRGKPGDLVKLKNQIK